MTPPGAYWSALNFRPWPKAERRLRPDPEPRRMAEPIALSRLSPGVSATLVSYPLNGSAFIRLREMGLLPGTRLTLIRVAPLGDPIEIKVRGYNLTLRKTEADHILIRLMDAS